MQNLLPQTWALGGCLVLASLWSIWASNTGVGVSQPTKNPPSIREHSARGRTTGHHRRTRYFFMGGGLRGGK